VVVGSGTRFLSGISVYTVRLAEALVDAGVRASVITMRQLLPTFLYPGKARVGTALTDLGSRSRVPTFDGIDWWWLPSLAGAAAFLRRRRPDTLVLQWWTGTVLHSYLALALLARAVGAKVVIEFHEVQDTGELRLPLVGRYSRLIGGWVIRLASGFTVHSAFDRDLLAQHWDLAGKPVAILPHGPHDHYQAEGEPPPAIREAPDDVCNILFFGVIRPYKGLEDLVAAFDRLTPAEIEGYWLTVVGETWEGHTLPAEMLARSPYRDRITFVNRYVHDAELDGYLRGADAVALPYRRSSLSGPLHVAMGYGLPIVMTDTGGNGEAAEGYEGILLMPVGDVESLTTRLRDLPALRGQVFEHPRSWTATADAYLAFLDGLDDADTAGGSPADRSP
jgi:glycosyltransferase involved in cell wall biosynthesis